MTGISSAEARARRDVAVHIHGLHKSFGDVEVLKGIDLTINPGEVVCVLGPSGSGKSTLLRCVNLLEQPTSGEIVVGDQEVTNLDCDIDKVRASLGMVFQSFNLFSHLDVLANCTSVFRLPGVTIAIHTTANLTQPRRIWR